MNKLTRIEELARKLNQEILALEVVQEYQKYEKLVLNDEKLKQLEKDPSYQKIPATKEYLLFSDSLYPDMQYPIPYPR